jgi:hypothetical protein
MGRHVLFLGSFGLSALAAAFLLSCDSENPAPALNGTGGKASSQGGSPSDTGGSSTTGGATGTGATGATGGGAAPIAVKGQKCSAANRLGGFWVAETFTSSTNITGTAVSGMVNDIAPPVAWAEQKRLGDCALMQKPVPFCSPACGERICTTSGTCVDAPKLRSVGTVTVSGLQSSVEIAPNNSNQYWFMPTTPVTAPAAGVQVTMAATGAGDSGPLNLSAEGVAHLQITSGVLEVKGGTPLTLTWTPPPQPTTGRLELSVNLASHGTDSAAIECSVPDTGTFDIPATLIDEAMKIEFAGFPKLTLVRYTADSVAIGSACFDFVVKSEVIRDDVQIYGYKFCTAAGEQAECPAGQICQSNYVCK